MANTILKLLKECAEVLETKEPMGKPQLRAITALKRYVAIDVMCSGGKPVLRFLSSFPSLHFSSWVANVFLSVFGNLLSKKALCKEINTELPNISKCIAESISYSRGSLAGHELSTYLDSVWRCRAYLYEIQSLHRIEAPSARGMYVHVALCAQD